jgi:hypothetical protein
MGGTKMKCNLESCTGIGEIQWMELQLERVPHDERPDYVIKNGHILREQYCREVCPVQKFRRKYSK